MKMIGKRITGITVFSLIVAFFCLVSTFAVASTLKIGVMNVQKVLVESKAGMAAKNIFEDKKKEIEVKLTENQEELKKLQDEIKKMSSVWSKEKKEEQILEFNKMRRDLQTKTEDGRMEMKRLQDKELQPILKTLETVVDDFGEKHGYSLIVDSKNGVIFYDKTYDVSDELIKALNAAM